MDGIHLRPGRPLLASSARTRAGALLACCAIFVAVLGVLFAHQAKADWLDHAVDSPIITLFGGHPGLAVRLAAPGSPIPAAVLSAAIVVTCLLTGRLNGAMLAAAAVPAAVGLNEGLLKPLVHRTYLGNVVYPSGHTTAMFALAATVTVLLLIPPQPGKTGVLSILIPAAACVLGGVVATAVIGLRWHYFTDTVAGAAVGIGTVCGLALILDLPAVRRWLVRASRQLPDGSGTPQPRGAGQHQGIDLSRSATLRPKVVTSRAFTWWPRPPGRQLRGGTAGGRRCWPPGSPRSRRSGPGRSGISPAGWPCR
jgi:membrane-associated phospholipid phosphatase